MASQDSKARRHEDMQKLLAEEPQRRRVSDDLARHGEKTGKSEKVQIVFVILSCIFITLQITGSLSTGAVLNSVQIIEQEQRRISLESCVQKFWEIAEVLQNNGTLNDSYNCAGSNLPNVITRIGSDIIVNHPQPQLLGYSKIVVSKSNPVPELIR
ncbi:MAG: hypothetical protein ACJA2D_002479 [Pseudohongiellaceae bacterium]|jgi:hypothetical protein